MPTPEKECRFGHTCTSSCGNDRDCPCQADHCCALTEDCDGSCDDCFNKKEEQCFCKSYYDENNLLQNCTCGKCK